MGIGASLTVSTSQPMRCLSCLAQPNRCKIECCAGTAEPLAAAWAQHFGRKEQHPRMAKRRGNPNWGKPEPIGPVVPTITSFEQVVKEYKLTPDQYIRSTRLREWARRNKNSKYIPEALLEAWGFEIESTL